MFIFFEINLWLNDPDSNIALLDSFFGAFKLKSDGSEFVKNVIIVLVVNRFSMHTDIRKKKS